MIKGRKKICFNPNLNGKWNFVAAGKTGVGGECFGGVQGRY